MKRTIAISLVIYVGLVMADVAAQAQQSARTPAEVYTGHFISLNKTVLAMAQEFPADKYDYSPEKGVRSFGDVIIHIASGNVYAAKAGRGEKVNWDELDPKNYKGKDQIVAELQKSINDAEATLKATPKDHFAQTPDPWFDVIEHEAEHMGQLVAYYRMNGLVPPQSRPKK
ncbi:MAG TPA: DinB family protein [Terriglobales bacterium]|jgi:uncharacterized damage-inducible protein DinB|nr:DinB family protein [Terriglobales bacterium]